MTFLLILVAMCILLLIAGRYLLKWIRFHMLARRLPSPRCVPFIGTVDALTASLSDLFRLTGQYFEECPRFFAIWLGPLPMVFLRDPRDVDIILRSGFEHTRKSLFYRFIRIGVGDGLFISGVEKWKQHRKLLAPAFHIKLLENFIEVFVRKSEILVRKLGEKADQKNFDCSTYFIRTAIDTIYETFLETESNCLEEDKDNSAATATILGSKYVMLRVKTLWLYPDFIYCKTKNGKEFIRMFEIAAKEAQEIIRNKRREFSLSDESKQQMPEEKLLGKKETPTFLKLLLQASEYGVNLSDEDIIDEIKTIVISGFDTMRITLCWTMQILGNHMEIQEKIYEEVENILQGNNRSISMNDLAEMKYLERVIKEVLRLYPAIPIISTTSTCDLEFGGYRIPAGIMMNIPITHVHRNPEIYPDPEKFDPDRFLPQREHRHPCAYIPFSAGPRNCIGQKYAMLQLKIIIMHIIRNYKIYSMREKLTPSTEIALTAEEGFHISISRRNTGRSYE